MEIDHEKLIEVLDLHCLYALKASKPNTDEVLRRIEEEVLLTSEIYLAKLTGVAIHRIRFLTRFVLADEATTENMRGEYLSFLITAAKIESSQ